MPITRKALFFILLLLFIFNPLNADFDGWITEAYGKGTKVGEPADWMEIYCKTAGSMSGLTLYHMYTDTGTRAKVFPAITAAKGDFIIVHFSDGTTADETDITGDTNGNGYWDVYTPHENSASWGITLSKGSFWLAKTDGTWLDYVVFLDGAITDNYKVNYALAASTMSHWSPEPQGTWTDDDYETYSVDTGDRATGISMQRKTGPNGDPEDTNIESDWEMKVTTEGEGYFIPISIPGMLKVENSPFFPYNDNTGQPTLGKVTFKLDSPNYFVTLAIFDINGYPVKYFLRNKTITSTSGSSTWDGTNDVGETVPVGIYIVYIEAEHITTGKIKKGQDTIVVGRKF